MDKRQHHCFSLSVFRQRVKSAENLRAAVYSLVLVLEARDLLTRKQFFYVIPNREKQWYVYLFWHEHFFQKVISIPQDLETKALASYLALDRVETCMN